MDEGRPFPLLPNTTAAWPWERRSRATDRETAGEAPPAKIANGHDALSSPRSAPPASEANAADEIAAVSDALVAERERTARLQQQIRALIDSSKTMRRESLAFRVRRWRDEEAIAELETQLAQTRRDRDVAIACSRQLTHEIALLYRRPWLAFSKRRLTRPNAAPSAARQSAADDAAPFFMRGFRLDDATVIVNGAARRARNARSGTMIYGPYVALPPGTYCAAVEARLYRALPVLAPITLEVVCDQARLVIESRRFLLSALAGHRRLKLIFSVGEGEDHADFEIRIWARQGTAVEVTHVDFVPLVRGRHDDAPQ